MSGGAGYRSALGIYTMLGRLSQPWLRRRPRLFRDAIMGRERCGEIAVDDAVRDARRRFWIHGASVGELRAAPPIVAELRRRQPDAAIVMSALTDTGLDVAREIEDIDLAFSLPLDLPGPVCRTLDRIRPDTLFVLETELWPRVLNELRSRSVPVVVLNGKLSAGGARSYRRLGALFRPLVADLDAVAAQSDADAARFVQLGTPRDRVRTCGSSKIDVLPEGPLPAPATRIGDRFLVVAGSIRAGEEKLLLDAWCDLKQRPGTESTPLLLLAPRHLDRVGELERRVSRRRLSACRRSRLNERLDDALAEASDAQVDVLILDSMGELAEAYPQGIAAIVGGGFRAPRGHNLLEPAMRGRPVLFGLHHVAVAGEDELLVEAGAGWRCRDARHVATILAQLLECPGEAWRSGQNAAAAVGAARGASARSLDFVAERLAW